MATELTDAAYARTSERYKLMKQPLKRHSNCVSFNKTLYVCRVKTSLSEGALRPSDLLAQFKQTEARTRTQIRAAELLDNTVELIREMVYTHTMVQSDPHGTEQQRRMSSCVKSTKSKHSRQHWTVTSLNNHLLLSLSHNFSSNTRYQTKAKKYSVSFPSEASQTR